jgi:hypothetical protein
MKKILFLASTGIILITASSFILSSNGIAGQTGSPGEGTCASCHSGGSGTTAVTITGSPDFSTGEYIPGQTYTVTVNVSNSGFSKFGFGCEVLNSSNANAGTIQNGGAGVTFANSGTKKNAIHSTPKTGTGAASFTFEWTAPNSGNVVIYAAGNAVNSNNQTSGDAGGNTSFSLTPLSTGINENIAISSVKIFPNPVSNELSIDYYLNSEADTKLSLYDLNGKEISVIAEGVQSGQQNANYTFLPSTESGIYIVKLFINGKQQTQRLIIKK